MRMIDEERLLLADVPEIVTCRRPGAGSAHTSHTRAEPTSLPRDP